MEEADGDDDVGGRRQSDGEWRVALRDLQPHGAAYGNLVPIGVDGVGQPPKTLNCNAERRAGVDEMQMDAGPGVAAGGNGQAGAGEGLLWLKQGPGRVVERWVGIAGVVAGMESPRRIEGDHGVDPRGVDGLNTAGLGDAAGAGDSDQQKRLYGEAAE